ncbi:MAG: hypothetical protein M3R55_06220 [Acidobacteriota bacterium]|nr:hypothetical protein [Acidobacteriota bacterium]
MTLAPAACPNCATPLDGAYCHACGQRRIDPSELRAGHFLRMGANELLHLDSRTLRSLLALLRRGASRARFWRAAASRTPRR